MRHFLDTPIATIARQSPDGTSLKELKRRLPKEEAKDINLQTKRPKLREPYIEIPRLMPLSALSKGWISLSYDSSLGENRVGALTLGHIIAHSLIVTDFIRSFSFFTIL